MSKSTKAQATAPANPHSLPAALAPGQTWVGLIRDLLTQGATTEQVKAAYVAARFPTFKARTAHATKDEKTLTSFLRKHADTHIKLARVDMDPSVQKEQSDRLLASISRTQARAAAQIAKATARGLSVPNAA